MYVIYICSKYTRVIPLNYKKSKTITTALKANNFAYIEPRWYKSRIFADYQKNLFSTKHDTSGRFLLVAFCEEQKRDRTERKW